MYDRNLPYNDLPGLPPSAEVETAAVLKKAIADDLRAWMPTPTATRRGRRRIAS